ncbi:Bug family tripartite tricarboxylate transporter substrate binding protein [Bacillus horti]|uniref:Tripartite-type tricarboxylate transporter receptor subunit TctC n=1 Tax=Caldalkalibacillus horti TaxID=77523 RepID=A0ABT9VWR3_9BACI|nr:tripartite tricarboxylate transporter substrate binding protein [Bacillus horti]MDQ0165045.1 tripartite-type tricarboxylate transporter receptor subunit TctC [Bacillus horti]
MNNKKNLYRLMLVALLSILVLAGCSGGTGGTAEDASNYPSKPIQLVVPYAAGGGTDAAARALVDAVKPHLTNDIGIMNKTGGGGAVGLADVSNASPDGYTLAMVTVELTTLPALGLAPFTPDDFTPIAQVNMDPGAITVRADAPWETAEEFIEHAKENPGLRIGNAGSGSIWHLVAATIAQETGTQFSHIPYDGAAPAVIALLSGEVDAVTVSPGEVLSQVESGELKTLAVAAEERVDAMPDVPTMEEAGIGKIVSGTWRGIAGPKDMPQEIVEQLETAFTAAANEESFENFMGNAGLGILVRGSSDFQDWIQSNSESWNTIVEELGLRE